MQKLLREHATKIYESSIRENKPNFAVKKALNERREEIEGLTGKIIIVSIGKAGWEMGKCAARILGERVSSGIVITKYNHIPSEFKTEHNSEQPSLVGRLGAIELHEASHPDRKSVV